MRHFNAVIQWLAAAVFTLCSGAIWAVLLQATPRFAPWFSLFVVLVAVFALRFCQVREALPRGLSSLAYFLLAAVYAQYLRAGVLVAMGIGFGLGPTLLRMGPEMATALALPRLGRADLIGIVAGAVLAFVLGFASVRRRL